MATHTCSKILDKSYRTVKERLSKPFISDPKLAANIEFIALCPGNRAGARFMLAATLAKIHKPAVDIRKPFIQAYSEEEKGNAYGGRNYDEEFVFDFVTKYRLPCSPTTAFLTPAFRTKNIVLDLSQKLRGRPAEMYPLILEILDAVQSKRVTATTVLNEVIRLLIIERNNREARLNQLKKGLREQAGALALSSEDTVKLIAQHLNLRHSARLPVLVIAAAYQAAAKKLRERVLHLYAHNAADKQTGALGDVEITILGDDKVVTAYEMKDKAVTTGDIDIAIQKIADGADIQNYIFVTTAAIDPVVRDYANQQYRELGGVEVTILDCVGFLRHFLHLFHRLRTSFLDAYEELVLSQPASGVSQELKEAFLALRRAAQAAD